MKPSEGSSGARELVLVVNREAGLHVTPEGYASTTGADSTDLADVLGEEKASIPPLSPAGNEDPRQPTLAIQLTHRGFTASRPPTIG